MQTSCRERSIKQRHLKKSVLGFEKRNFVAYLDELVPTSRDDDGVLWVGAEPHTRDPLSVAFLGNGVLAVAESVPELDRPVARARDDLAVVGGERDGENVVGVADKGTGGVTGGQLPETERLVPGGRQSVGTVGGDHL